MGVFSDEVFVRRDKDIQQIKAKITNDLQRKDVPMLLREAWRRGYEYGVGTEGDT